MLFEKKVEFEIIWTKSFSVIIGNDNEIDYCLKFKTILADKEIHHE